MTPDEVLRLGAYALAGFILGAASFAILRMNTRLYVASPGWWPASMHLLRLIVVAAALFLASRQGAGPLLAVAGGFVAARPLMVRLLGSHP